MKQMLDLFLCTYYECPRFQFDIFALLCSPSDAYSLVHSFWPGIIYCAYIGFSCCFTEDLIVYNLSIDQLSYYTWRSVAHEISNMLDNITKKIFSIVLDVFLI